MITVFFAILSCAFIVMVGYVLYRGCIGYARTEAARDVVDSAKGVFIDHKERTIYRYTTMSIMWLIASVSLGIFLYILEWAPAWCPVFYLPLMWGAWTTEFRHHMNSLRGREGYLGVDSAYDLWWIGRTTMVPHKKSNDHFREFKEDPIYRSVVQKAERNATRFELGVTIASCILMVGAIIIHQFT